MTTEAKERTPEEVQAAIKANQAETKALERTLPNYWSEYNRLVDELSDLRGEYTQARKVSLRFRDPGKKTKYLWPALVFVRGRVQCLTSDVAIAMQWHTDRTTKTLEELQARVLIGRQVPLPLGGTGHYESTWAPLRTPTWPDKT